MRFSKKVLGRSSSETSIIPASRESRSSACFHSNYKRAAIYALYIGAVVVILWQTRSLYPDTPTLGGYLLVCLKIFVIMLVVVSSIKLFFSVKDFYSHLHNEDYIPSPSKSRRGQPWSGGQGDESGRDEDDAAHEEDDFEEFCRREGFPLPHRKKKEEPSEAET